MMMENTGIVILAAGRSARLGTAKQLLPFQGKTLLQHVVDEATAAGVVPVIVVTGARSEAVSSSIDPHQADIIFNENWEEGKGSGVVAGVQKIMTAYPEVQDIILAVCDQPFVTATLFTRLQEQRRATGKRIIASAYAGTMGTPVLFAREYFGQLLGLKKDEGAKRIIDLHRGDVATVDFPRGEVDIDTMEDYNRFLEELNPNIKHA